MTDPAPRPVLVIGEALVDEFPDGRRVAGGAPFNQARWLAALGVPVRFVTRTGQGDFGAACVLSGARLCGLAEDGMQRDPQRATGRVVVQLGGTGPVYRIEADAAWDHIDAAQALKRADWVKVNDEELDRLLAWFVCDGPPPAEGPAKHAALAELAARFGVQRWIVTCGERGWFTLDREGRRNASGAAPAVPHIVDTVGAAQLAAAVCSVRGAVPEDQAFTLHWRDKLDFAATSAHAAPGHIA